MFKPGQYISVNIFVDELDGGIWQARQYSLSDAPGKKYLRISVKKEPGIAIGEPSCMTHPGYISNLLHDLKKEGDVVRVSHPFGDFFFEDKEEDASAPVVLVSAGVGLTALMSIFNTLVEKKSPRSISWIHGARSISTRAFRSHVDQLAAKIGNLNTIYFSSSPLKGGVNGQQHDIEGRVDLDKVNKEQLFTDNDAARYFVCGPAQFMLDIESKLKCYGVSGDRIKMELFGTGGVPRT